MMETDSEETTHDQVEVPPDHPAGHRLRGDGRRATLAYWLQYRVGGKTKSMAVVFRPERCLFPRDKIALGHEHWEWDVTFGQFEGWLREKGYVLRGPVVEPE